jgi:hypothetical protein
MRTIMEGWGTEITSKYNNLQQFAMAKNASGSETLREVLINFGHADASNPLDKIYAFLGIAKDGYEILPDYGALVEDVYIGAVKTYIKNEGDLEIICSHY